MPKELHEIKNFQAGTITTPSDTDIPEESAVYSKNIDPIAEDGKLRGIPDDTDIATIGAPYKPSTYGAEQVLLKHASGMRTKHDIVYLQTEANVETSEILNNADFSNWSSYTSLSNFTTKPDNWNVRQEGNIDSNFRAYNNDDNSFEVFLRAAGSFVNPTFYLSQDNIVNANLVPGQLYKLTWTAKKILKSTAGGLNASYIYHYTNDAVENYTEYDISDGSEMTGANYGSNYGSGNGLGHTMYTTSHPLFCDSDNPVTPTMEEIVGVPLLSSYIEITVTGVIGGIPATRNLFIDGEWGSSGESEHFFNVNGEDRELIFTLPTEMSSITDISVSFKFKHNYKIVGGQGSSWHEQEYAILFDGDLPGWFESIFQIPTLRFNLSGVSLKAIALDQIGIVENIYPAYATENTSIYLAGYQAAAGNMACMEANNEAVHIGGGGYDNYYSGWVGRIKYPSIAFVFTGTTETNPYTGLYSIFSDLRPPVIHAYNNSYTNMHWIMPANYSGNAGLLVGGTRNNTGDGKFEAGYTYIYKYSFVYDKYQESPLSAGDTRIGMTTDEMATQSILIELRILSLQFYLKSSGKKYSNRRISHINIYRSKYIYGEASSTAVGFRFIKSISLMTNNTANGSISSVNGDYGWICGQESVDITKQGFSEGSGNSQYNLNSNLASSYTPMYFFKDTGDTIGATYESLNGISETLKSTSLNHSLSTQINGMHIVGDAYVENYGSGTKYENPNFLFRSKPGNFDQFDWSVDFLGLPTRPTALAAFNGRIYAFDKNNTYRIDPNSFVLEDIYEGVGCLGKQSIAVSEYGMCFADDNNIYLHDGRTPRAIGEPILRGDATYSWQNKSKWAVYQIGDFARREIISFDGKRNSFVIFFKASNDDYMAWAYNIARNRWDLWDVLGTTSPTGGISGGEGEILIGDASNSSLKRYLQGGGERSWDWTSKKITTGYDSQYKKFKKVRVTGNTTDCISNINTSEGNDITKTGASDGANGYVYTLTDANKNAKWIQYVITGQTGVIDSVGAIFRRRPVK